MQSVFKTHTLRTSGEQSRTGTTVEKQWLFDRVETQEFTRQRQTFVSELLSGIGPQFKLRSALDVGCGVGDLSKFLSEMKLRVVGVDGRAENAAEARRRYPNIQFVVGDAEDLSNSDLGLFDLVLCFGLLYHLENPFRAIRRLHSVTEKILLIESMCVPSANSTMELLDETPFEDQSLNCVAFYPSQRCLIKMLYKAGFGYVYSFPILPVHALYTETIWRKRLRTVLLASREHLESPNLALETEPIRFHTGYADPWTTKASRTRDFCNARLFQLKILASRFLRPFRRKERSAH
jgi:SAM-dependent methyltransferase